MHTPAAFRSADPEAAFDLIRNYGFATLVTVEGGASVVSHLPMIGDAKKRVLRGHLARANPHSAILDGRRHLAAFSGANAYVSPDWYGDAEQVPTWNYSAIHIEGEARVLTEPVEIDSLLGELSDLHERRRHDLVDGGIWTLAKLPIDKLRKMRAAIVAFEIGIDKLEFKVKLSQNKSAEDFQRVTEKLASGDDGRRAVAGDMRALRK